MTPNWRGRQALALLALGLAACQAPVPGGLRSSSSPPAPPAPLAAADGRFFAGDYDAAEKAYRELAGGPRPVAAAHAHLSLLMTYESRFREAVAEAQMAVNAQADSANLARLARALDWSGDVPGALAAAARAVASRPVDPLAHVFYSEALADGGRYQEAQRELKAAGDGGRDAFLRAEIDREWANYYRDRSDSQQELRYLQRAQREQPRFPERDLEIARYHYGKKSRQAARDVLEAVRKHDARVPSVLACGGDAAGMGGDTDEALSLYEEALKAEPELARASLGWAQAQVAGKRDFRAAHDRLLEALRRTPGSPDLYSYLRYLDLLLLDRDPDQELGPITPQPPAELAAARRAALERVNGYRAAVALPAVAEDAALTAGAEAHAFYFLFNFGQKQEEGLGIHSEDPALPGFTGADGLSRGRHFGYQGTRGAEVINHVFLPHAAVQVWVDSVYHRFPALDRDSRQAGYGQAQVGGISIQIIDFGLAPPQLGEAVAYPYPDQRDVPAAFLGNELPNPTPEGAEYPVGYPVTLQLPAASQLSIRTSRLLGPDNQEVPSYILNPGTKVGHNEWSLLAKKPLTRNTKYTVEVIGEIDGRPYTRRWSFTVEGA